MKYKANNPFLTQVAWVKVFTTVINRKYTKAESSIYGHVHVFLCVRVRTCVHLVPDSLRYDLGLLYFNGGKVGMQSEEISDILFSFSFGSKCAVSYSLTLL